MGQIGPWRGDRGAVDMTPHARGGGPGINCSGCGATTTTTTITTETAIPQNVQPKIVKKLRVLRNFIISFFLLRTFLETKLGIRGMGVGDVIVVAAAAVVVVLAPVVIVVACLGCYSWNAVYTTGIWADLPPTRRPG